MRSPSTSSDPDLPSYDRLAVAAGGPPRSSWGLWGPEDRLGCLNLLTPATARRGIAEARTGAAFPLDLDLGAIDPPLFGRPAHRHRVHTTVSGHEDELHDWNPQSGTQWDGFRHVRHPEHGFYNGLDGAAHGTHVWAQHGIVGRAVLADVARWRAARGRPIQPFERDGVTPADVAATLEEQGTTVATGDIILIRTGWLTAYRTLDGAQRAELAGAGVPTACGLDPGEGTARYLWDLHVAAAATDAPGFEVMPPEPDRFLHHDLLALLGLPLGELFDLDALATSCATDRRWTAMLVAAPISVVGGVAAPGCAVAIR